MLFTVAGAMYPGKWFQTFGLHPGKRSNIIGSYPWWKRFKSQVQRSIVVHYSPPRVPEGMFISKILLLRSTADSCFASWLRRWGPTCPRHIEFFVEGLVWTSVCFIFFVRFCFFYSDIDLFVPCRSSCSRTGWTSATSPWCSRRGSVRAMRLEIVWT